MSTGKPRDDTPPAELRRRLITIYGRNAVFEALQDTSLDCRILHLATSNKRGAVLRDIEAVAERRGLQTRHHDREALARISRNGRQDQGIALDVHCPSMSTLEDFLQSVARDAPLRLMALDGVTNPQNMGMAIRSATAAGIDGFLYADRGNPALGPLVIKASAGSVFRAPLLRCRRIDSAANQCLDEQFTLYRLQAGGERDLFDENAFADRSLFVLGGESQGLTDGLRRLPGVDVAIPMARGVESLNVAVSAALVAYRSARS